LGWIFRESTSSCRSGASGFSLEKSNLSQQRSVAS
jgi:hypothetical protein